jgi:hypothetical protein
MHPLLALHEEDGTHDRGNQERERKCRYHHGMSILDFLRGASKGRSDDVETWSTAKLTEVMMLLHEQLHHAGTPDRQRAEVDTLLRRITREIEKRKLG